MNRQIKAILIDLSGTLHIDNSAISGAQEALNRLRKTNIKIKFVTNTTKESKNVLYNRLQSLGFDIKRDEIFSSLAAARQTIINRALNPYLLIDSAAMEDFEDLVKSGEHDSVVIGLAPEKFNYDHLNNAFRLILNGASLIAIHEGRYYKRPDGLALGPGAFVKGLEYATNAKAEVIGKPCAGFFKAALEEDIAPEEAIMIGDDVKDDIAGAQAVGIRGILVQTGKYRPGDESTIEPPPTKICKSFVEAVDSILNNL